MGKSSTSTLKNKNKKNKNEMNKRMNESIYEYCMARIRQS